jgi:hypothetical protein
MHIFTIANIDSIYTRFYENISLHQQRSRHNFQD